MKTYNKAEMAEIAKTLKKNNGQFVVLFTKLLEMHIEKGKDDLVTSAGNKVSEVQGFIKGLRKIVTNIKPEG